MGKNHKEFIRVGAIKIQQWRRNPSPAPYSALSRGSKIPNLKAAAQAAAAEKNPNCFRLPDFPGQDPDFPLTTPRGGILFLNFKNS